jgi:hypothetical protein
MITTLVQGAGQAVPYCVTAYLGMCAAACIAALTMRDPDRRTTALEVLRLLMGGQER